MKIAIIAATLPEPGRKLGGVEVFIHRLANHLAQLPQHQVTVYSLSDRPIDAQYQHQILFSQLAHLRRRKLFVWLIFPVLLNFVRWPQPDIIHCFGDDWFYLRRTTATLRTMNGSALNEAKTATTLKRKIAQSLIYPLEHLSVKLATLTVGIGQDSQTIYHLPKIINIGVDQTRFHPGPKSTHPTILFIGTWQGRKRGQLIYNTFIEQILPQIPQTELWMVSDHCPEHPQVKSFAFPDDATLAQLYRSAWVFAYPSCYEGFGMPYVEALASGTPIVTSPNSGAASILQQGQYGNIVDDSSFATALLTLLQDASLRAHQSQAGLQRSRDFSWDTITQEYIATYETAIDRFSPPASRRSTPATQRQS